jgi:hypothetical protein
VAACTLEEYSNQNQLKDSERLAAFGATAGMVGHNIRNLKCLDKSRISIKKAIMEPKSQKAT